MRFTRKGSIVAALLVAVLSAAVVLSMIYGLHARVFVINADIGIPGITKMYGATLTNRGLVPVRTKQCDFVDDGSYHGTTLPYAVQRWNETRKQWETLMKETPSGFCKPYPLGIVKSRIVDRWLWPGQSIQVGGEATAGRDGFNLGDHVRFLVFLRTAGDTTFSIPTNDFVIDEHPQDTSDVRVKH